MGDERKKHMALGDPISITYNGVAKSLAKIYNASGGIEYTLDEVTIRYTLSVKHTIPPKGESGESHLARLDVDHYDASNVLLRTSSAWMVIKTFEGVQLATASDYAAQALVDFLTDGNIDKLIARES
nr:MAG: hypothetical protein 2 [Leviviridae sp.]